MTEEMVIAFGGEAVRMTILLAGPMLAAALLIGIIVSILQAVTQINESTLTFIPKMIAVVVVLAVCAPWMLQTLQEYAQNIFSGAGGWIR